MKPTKQAYLKHDLFKVVIPTGISDSGYTADEVSEAISKITYKKIASKGMKFVWCETEPLNGRLTPKNMGWFADASTGMFVAGNCGFGQMSSEWGKKNLTEQEPFKREPLKEFDDD